MWEGTVSECSVGVEQGVGVPLALPRESPWTRTALAEESEMTSITLSGKSPARLDLFLAMLFTKCNFAQTCHRV